jgi:hypothetical protein
MRKKDEKPIRSVIRPSSKNSHLEYINDKLNAAIEGISPPSCQTLNSLKMENRKC